MYAAMTDIAAIYHDPDYLSAVSNLWNNMVEKKIYLTGGIGARHEGESFGDNYELPNQTAYSETCAAIGSVFWCHRLFLLTGDVKYYDIIERTLYNALIAGISADGIKFFYPNRSNLTEYLILTRVRAPGRNGLTVHVVLTH